MEKMLIMALFLTIIPLSQAKSNCIVFNFGDSNSDTGSSMAIDGNPGNINQGRLFFHRPTGRFSDGRLIIDFLCENASIPFLSPYIRPFDGDFHNGANFAFGGSTARKIGCFGLPDQVGHFLTFKRLLELQNVSETIIEESAYRSAVYMLDIGQNDINIALNINAMINETVSGVIAEIRRNIETLYKEVGARKFWVHNTGPLGCLPIFSEGRKDANNCTAVPNDAVKELNIQRQKLIDELRTTLVNSTIVYVDIYSIKYDLFVNYTKYGFQDRYQYCTPDDISACPEGSKYIAWDIVHYTELANSIVASKILTGDYSDPPIKFADLCSG